MANEKIEFLRRGGRVKRFHGFHLLMENTVGHHTFNLMGILYVCVPDGKLASRLLVAAMLHDVPECITGDVPAPFKRNVTGLREAMQAEEDRLLGCYGITPPTLYPEEERWLKLADSLDGAYHCLEERRLGNTTLDRIFWTFIGYVNQMDNHPEDVKFQKLCLYLTAEWFAIGGRGRTDMEALPHD